MIESETTREAGTRGWCRVEAELRLPARWRRDGVIASRVQSAVLGRSGDAVSDELIWDLLGAQGGSGPISDPALAYASLGSADRLELARHSAEKLCRDPVRAEEARARIAVLEALATMRERAALHGVAWRELTVNATARAGEGKPVDPGPGMIARLAGRLRGHKPGIRKIGPDEPHVSVRVAAILEGQIGAMHLTVERDRALLKQVGYIAWFRSSVESRRPKRRQASGADLATAQPLPAVGARLLELLRETVACLSAETIGAPLTAARALATFVQMHPDVGQLLMLDPNALQSNEGFPVDEPGDMGFELHRRLRGFSDMRHRSAFRELFFGTQPRMGILRLIELRIRNEIEQRQSPPYAAAFRRVFGDAANALLHWRAMQIDGVVPPSPASRQEVTALHPAVIALRESLSAPPS